MSDNRPTSPLTTLPASTPPLPSSPPVLSYRHQVTPDSSEIESSSADEIADESVCSDESALHEPLSRLSQVQKLQRVVDTLRDVRWSFQQLLQVWSQEFDRFGNELRLNHRRYSTALLRRRVFKQAVTSVAHICSNIEDSNTHVFTREFSSLRKAQYFQTFGHTMDMLRLDGCLSDY